MNKKPAYYVQEGSDKLEGPFTSKSDAKAWVRRTSANAWITACGCLRDGWSADNVRIFELVEEFEQVIQPQVKVILRKKEGEEGEGGAA